jgi:hypothetical protein
VKPPKVGIGAAGQPWKRRRHGKCGTAAREGRHGEQLVVTRSLGEHLQFLEPCEREVDIYCWRVEVLERVGYTGAFAHWLAEDTAIDLHRACELKTSGCTESTAYAILC